tara:strand:+ start:274 stop:468 length:195 start_codon:yes stop_codon:yes gene_type:complete
MIELALAACEHFGAALADGMTGVNLELHYFACMASMKQEYAEVQSFSCVAMTGANTVCEFGFNR